MAAVAGRKAFSNRREQRNSQIRHPVHLGASDSIGGPFAFNVKTVPFTPKLFLLVMLQFRLLTVKSNGSDSSMVLLDKGIQAT